jgi:hypothetical protein
MEDCRKSPAGWRRIDEIALDAGEIALALALVIPAGFIVLATVLGIFGALMGLAFMALRIALICLIVWGALKFGMWLFRSMTASSPTQPIEVKSLPPVDRHYEAAMRELDRELGEVRR